MNPFDHDRISRRASIAAPFLQRSAYGLGGLALGTLAARAESPATAGATAGKWPGVIQARTSRSRRSGSFISAWPAGRRSSRRFDWKPELKGLDGQPFPESFTKGQQLAQLQNTVLKARGPFCRVQEVRPDRARRSPSCSRTSAGSPTTSASCARCMTEQINHDPGAGVHEHRLDHQRPAEHGLVAALRPGAETDNLPGFIVLMSRARHGGAQPVSARQWSSGFLPSKFQGIQFQTQGRRGALRRQSRRRLPEHAAAGRRGDQAAQRHARRGARSTRKSHTRIAQYELAFKMQTSVPELTDFQNEPQQMLDMYGVKQPGDGTFASNCLLARRLAERGVRFIQLYHRALGSPRRHRERHADRGARTSTRPAPR